MSRVARAICVAPLLVFAGCSETKGAAPVPTASAVPAASAVPTASTRASALPTSTPSAAVDDCGLPEALPADAVFGVRQLVLPHGKPSQTFGGELHAGEGRCESTPCDVVPRATLAKLWQTFRSRGFGSIRNEPAQRTPHYGSRTIWVTWSTERCEKTDDSRQKIASAQHTTFYDLFRLVTEAAPRTRD